MARPAGHGIGRFAAVLRRARGVSRARRLQLLALVGASVAVLCLTAWPFVKAHLQAFAVLRDVAGESVPGVARPLMVAVKTEDFNFTVEAPGGQQTVRARLYLPEGRRNAAAMVILHGVHHLGIDEPRLMGFAAAMASCGIQVLTPELPDIKDYHVSEDSVRTIGESVRWFAKRTGGPVGVMGLSFSGGLALVAAADPLYHPAFKFVFAVGSQDSMARVSNYYWTNSDVRPDGTTEVLPAHEYGPLVLEYEYLDEFVPPQDLGPIRAVLRAHLYEDKRGEAEASLKLNEVQKREALDLMDATSPQMRAKIAAVVAKHANETAGVSPHGRLKTLNTPVYLLHGEADNIIPSAETLWMASELRQEDLEAMLVSPVLSHVGLAGPDPGLMDKWRLIHFLALVVHAAESR